MRCDCCNKVLNDYEATRKSATTGEYLNTCNKCLDGLGIETVDRVDLAQFEQISEDDFDDSEFIDEIEDDYSDERN